jgi:long-subunit fatty acid transport protein
MRKGTIYGFTSEEVFLRAKTKTTGITFFDRNRFELGGGYQINDDIQLEMGYSNEYLPRDKENEIYNALNITLSFNNMWDNLKKKFISPKPAVSKKN